MGAGSHSRGAHKEGWSTVCSLRGQGERWASAESPSEAREKNQGASSRAQKSPRVCGANTALFQLLPLCTQGCPVFYLSFQPSVQCTLNPDLHFIGENETTIIPAYKIHLAGWELKADTHLHASYRGPQTLSLSLSRSSRLQRGSRRYS